MSLQINAIIDRIEADLELLRTLVSREQKPSLITVKARYNRREAAAEKQAIEDAYLRGEITYDKKRGMKMLVTKATVGWTPVKAVA